VAVANSINESTTGVSGFTGTAFVGTPVTQYNVLTGSSTSSTLNNVAPSATSGIPLISQGAAVQPTFGTAAVAGGGTGNTTFTAYSVICAGTTSTGAFQNVSGVGAAGQVLTSNGAGALPTWQNAPTGGASLAFQITQTSGSNPADGVTYFMTNQSLLTLFTASTSQCRQYMPMAGTINKCYGNVRVDGTLGSAQNVTIALRLNNTSNSNVTTTLQLTSANQTFNTTSLGLSVVAGDYIEVIIICPTWTTNPTTVSLSLTYLVE